MKKLRAKLYSMQLEEETSKRYNARKIQVKLIFLKCFQELASDSLEHMPSCGWPLLSHGPHLEIEIVLTYLFQENNRSQFGGPTQQCRGSESSKPQTPIQSLVPVLYFVIKSLFHHSVLLIISISFLGGRVYFTRIGV